MMYCYTAKLLLIVYGAIALAGQGLHGLMHHHAPAADTATVAVDSHAGCSHGKSKCTHHAPRETACTPCTHHAPRDARHAERDGYKVLHQPTSPGCGHDHATCGICQHQSLGQMLSVPPLPLAGETAGEQHHNFFPQAVVATDRHSSAQPRAPPVV